MDKTILPVKSMPHLLWHSMPKSFWSVLPIWLIHAKTAEKVDAHLRQFGGAASARTTGVLFMRTKGLPDGTAEIPVTLDPSLRLDQQIAEFSLELQRYNRFMGTDELPIIGLVPFSNILSVLM